MGWVCAAADYHATWVLCRCGRDAACAGGPLFVRDGVSPVAEVHLQLRTYDQRDRHGAAPCPWVITWRCPRPRHDSGTDLQQRLWVESLDDIEVLGLPVEYRSPGHSG
jgi:hypothetical protein